jgi:glycosyltransferase involved in cell wall biosynthesis
VDSFRNDDPSRLASRVRFTSWLGHEALRDEFQEASLILCPSRFETFGLAALEAMSFGLPVVGTRCGGLEDLVDHGETGLLCASGDVAGLVQSVLQLCERPRLRAQIGRNAQAKIRRELLWSTVVHAYLDQYCELQNRPGSPGR